MAAESDVRSGGIDVLRNFHLNRSGGAGGQHCGGEYGKSIHLLVLPVAYWKEGLKVCGALEAVIHFSTPFGIWARPSLV